MDLLAVLKTLDPTNDSLWTDDGLPALDAVKAATGDSKITRSALNKVALGLTRDNVATYEPPTKAEESEVSSDTVVEAPIVTTVALGEVPALQAQIEAVREEINATLKQRNDLTAKLDDLTVKLQDLEKKIPIAEIEAELERANMESYLKRAKEEREARGEILRKLKETGLSLDQVKEIVNGKKVVAYERIG